MCQGKIGPRYGGLRGFKGSKVQRFRGSGVQGFRVVSSKLRDCLHSALGRAHSRDTPSYERPMENPR